MIYKAKNKILFVCPYLHVPTHKNCPYPKYLFWYFFLKKFIRNIELNAVLHLKKVLIAVNFRFNYTYLQYIIN